MTGSDDPSHDAPTELRVEILIHGRVQGVWYRASAQAEARALGLKGWVRNEPRGEVRAVAEGPRHRLELFVAWCRQGPPKAVVTGVDVRWLDPAGEFRDFTVAR